MPYLGEGTCETDHPEAPYDAAGTLETEGDRGTFQGGYEKPAPTQ
jgi:hypothetical protein